MTPLSSVIAKCVAHTKKVPRKKPGGQVGPLLHWIRAAQTHNDRIDSSFDDFGARSKAYSRLYGRAPKELKERFNFENHNESNLQFFSDRTGVYEGTLQTNSSKTVDYNLV